MTKRGRTPQVEKDLKLLRQEADAKDKVIDSLRTELTMLKDKLMLVHNISKMVGM